MLRCTVMLLGTNEDTRLYCCACLVAMSCLCDPTDSIVHQAPQSTGFSRQEHWDGLPFPSPGDLLDPGTEFTSLASGRWILYPSVPACE